MRTAGTGHSWLHRRTLPNVMFLESYPDICCSQSYPVGKSCIHSYQGMNTADSHVESDWYATVCLDCTVFGMLHQVLTIRSVATEVGITVYTRRLSAVSRESSSPFFNRIFLNASSKDWNSELGFLYWLVTAKSNCCKEYSAYQSQRLHATHAFRDDNTSYDNSHISVWSMKSL